MVERSHYQKLERAYVTAPVNKIYRPTIHVEDGKADIEMEVGSQFWHAASAVHGSVYFKALDDAAFFAANSLIEDWFVLTLSFNVYFTRPIVDGKMKARGTVVHRTRRLLVAESTVTNDDGKEVGRGSGTFVVSQIPLGPEVGYE